MSVHPLVIVADDDDDFRELLCEELARHGIDYVGVGDGGSLLEYVDLAYAQPFDIRFPDVLITDLRMPRKNGFEVCAYASFIPTIVMTGFGTRRARDEARRLGARYVFEKPFDCGEMLDAIRELIDARRR